MNIDYNVMGLFSRFKKKKKDTEKREDKTTKGSNEHQKTQKNNE